MAKSEPQIEELRERLNSLLADWSTEITAVLRALENEQSAAATRGEKVQVLQSQVNDLEELRQRVRDRDLALDYLKRKSKEKDQRIAELENEHEKACARIDELERQLAALNEPSETQISEPQDDHQAELEAMRAELAARKSLVKNLRADAERGKRLAQELADSRDVIAKMRESIERHARTIAELRGSTSGASSVDEPMEAEGARTVVIDMTEPLLAAREARRSSQKG